MKPGSKAWKKFMAKIYGFGAAIVIVGAMFKIQHWPGAGAMLVCGLTIEALIFFFSAFEPIHEDIDWSLVYPELAGMHGEEEHKEEEHKLEEAHGSITEQLDHMLEEAKIEPALIESLGQGLRNLSENAGKMSDVSEATVATSEYVNNMKGASKSVESLSNTYDEAKNTISASVDQLSSSYSKVAKSLEDTSNQARNTITSSADQLSDSYSKVTKSLEDTYDQAKKSIFASVDQLAGSYDKAGKSLEDFSNSSQSSFQEAKTYGEQLQKVTKNLSALNASYELQLQGSNEHLQATGKLYGGIEVLMKNLNDSIQDTQKYKQEITQLSSNLEALNTVYGNMLNAMNVRK